MRAVFLIVVLAVWAAGHVYVFQRAMSVLPRRIPRRAVIAIGAALAASFVLARLLDDTVVGAPLNWLGSTWLGVFFLLLVCTLAADLMTGFGFVLRRQVTRVRAGALVTALLLSMVALVQGMRAPVVSEFEVPVAGLPADADGTVVVVLTDLHLGSMLGESWLTARVDQVLALDPDLIALVGDLFEGHGVRHSEQLVAQLNRLSAPLGVWAVTGNHERHGDDAVAALERAELQLLRDRWAEARDGLVVAGVDDLGHRRSADPVPSDGLERALAGVPRSTATLLLSHRPTNAEVAAAAGADLMLCGHTHGGQLWPFTFFVALAEPLLAGLYQIDSMPVIVSRGTGTWGPRMRLWAPGEIVQVTLRAQ